jgi:FixJ family two-component response regulator
MTPSGPAGSSLLSGGRVAAGGNVLVVDDEVFIRNAFQLYLETVGYTVQSAESGERAVAIFDERSQSLDVVILDLMMPGMLGTDLLKVFKARDPSVEVIIVTGCGSLTSAIEALRCGAFDYIQKPIVNFDQDLLKVVEEAVRSRREKRERASTGAAASAAPPDRLFLLDRLVEIAGAMNRARQSQPAPEVQPALEMMERLLGKCFGVSGGLVLYRDLSGDFSPVYSWGFSGPLSTEDQRLPDSGVFAALREGSLAFFPVTVLDSGRLGIQREDLAGWRELACLPLPVQGSLWGGLILFFAEELPPHLSGPADRHPFQLLGPVLAPVISGSLRHPRG